MIHEPPDVGIASNQSLGRQPRAQMLIPTNLHRISRRIAGGLPMNAQQHFPLRHRNDSDEAILTKIRGDRYAAGRSDNAYLFCGIQFGTLHQNPLKQY